MIDIDIHQLDLNWN